MKSISVGSKAIVLAALSLTTVSCLGDKTIEDYRQKKVQEELGRIQAIEGTYRGALISKRDELPLGAVSIDLRADTQIQNSSDNLSSEQQAIVRGTISYAGAVATQVVFQQGFVDREGTTFKGKVTIIDPSGTPIPLTLQGQISAGTFSGSLDADNFEQYGAHFTLIKDGPAVTTENLQAARIRELRSEKQVFVGYYPYRDDPRTPFTLTLIEPDLKNDQEFLKLFLPMRDLKVNCDFGGGTTVFFPSAHLDARDQSLHALTQITRGYSQHWVSLDCTSHTVGYSIQSWHCIYKGSGMKDSLQIDLEPASAGEGR